MESQYTLPGVMQFLRSEWQQREQTRIEWELERAELLSRLGRLESENMDLRRDLNASRRHLDILTTRHRRGETSGSSSPANGSTNDKTTDPVPPVDLDEIQAANDDLTATVKDSKSYLKQCIADIRHVLRHSGTISGDADAMVAPRLGHGSQNFVTLANFGSSALAVAALPNHRVAAGTFNGELLIWDVVDVENSTVGSPTTFDALDGPINSLQYSEVSDRLLVACGNEIRVYDLQATPKLVTAKKISADVVPLEGGLVAGGPDSTDGASIVHLAAAATGNLLATVLSDGRTSVWALQEGRDLQLMSVPANGVLACAFASVHNDVHLVLARGPDTSVPDNAEGSLLLADPITGESLKKIVFLFTAGISAMTVTKDTIVLGTDNGDIRVIGLARGETIAEITSAHRSEVTSLTTQTDSSGYTALISTSVDGRVSVWTLPNLMWKGRMFSHDSAYGALGSSSGHGRVIICGGDGLIRVYAE